jgi:hypothetical protein
MQISFARTISCTKKSDDEIYESQRHCSSASCHYLFAVAAVAKPTPGLTKIIHICTASCKNLFDPYYPGLPQGKLSQEITSEYSAEAWRRGFLIVHIVNFSSLP